jgi:hypothetical protein
MLVAVVSNFTKIYIAYLASIERFSVSLCVDMLIKPIFKKAYDDLKLTRSTFIAKIF